MRFGFQPPSIVWFCIAETCDDQSPWKAEEVVKCPGCGKTDDVTRAVRFGNLETDENGNRRII